MSIRGNVLFKCFRKMGHPRHKGEPQLWEQTDTADTLNVFDNSEGRTPILTCEVYDARGNGGGETVNTLTGDHESRVTDYTALGTDGAAVRRLTPLECERLQGYPDGWTDIGEWTDTKGKKHKDADSTRYKALGNSIALPFWQWMARRICAQYIRPVTMGSLFDGIGGFPLVFQRAGAVPIWASEIEEFPIAVTKKRFGEGDQDELGG